LVEARRVLFAVSWAGIAWRRRCLRDIQRLVGIWWVCEIRWNRDVRRWGLVYLFQDALLFVFGYEIGNVEH
jgi:hypothetical protein